MSFAVHSFGNMQVAYRVANAKAAPVDPAGQVGGTDRQASQRSADGAQTQATNTTPRARDVSASAFGYDAALSRQLETRKLAQQTSTQTEAKADTTSPAGKHDAIPENGAPNGGPPAGGAPPSGPPPNGPPPNGAAGVGQGGDNAYDAETDALETALWLLEDSEETDTTTSSSFDLVSTLYEEANALFGASNET